MAYRFRINKNKNNTSGHAGVSICRKKYKGRIYLHGFRAKFMFEGKMYNCGPVYCYKTIKEAVYWYKKTKEEMMEKQK